MKIVIEISKEIESDYVADKFKDFFERVIADMDYSGLCGNYEKEIAEVLLRQFQNSEPMV